MKYRTFFYELSQGNQEQVLIGQKELIGEEINLAKLESKESLFWWYYGKLISEPIEEEGLKFEEDKVWLSFNRFQKGLVSMNVLIWQEEMMLYNFPHYFFAITETLKMFQIDRLSIAFDKLQDFIKQHLSKEMLEDELFKDFVLFDNLVNKFLDNHHDDSAVFSLDSEFLDNLYIKLVDTIENNLQYFIIKK